MATIQERKKKNGKTTYTATIRVKGHPPITATFEKKTLASKWIQETEPKIREGRYFTEYEAKKHTLNELIDRYIEVELPKRNKNDHKKYKMQLEWWKKQIGSYTLGKISSCSKEITRYDFG